MTTHDEDSEMAAAAAPWTTAPGVEVVVTVDEAHQAFAQLGGATANMPGVAELLRRVIAAGRSTRVAFIEDETLAARMRRFRQYPSIEALEAAIDAGELPMSPGFRSDRYLAERTGSDGKARPAAIVLMREIMAAEGVDEQEAAHRLIERAGLPRKAGHVCAGAACFGDPDCPVYSTRKPAGS